GARRGRAVSCVSGRARARGARPYLPFFPPRGARPKPKARSVRPRRDRGRATIGLAQEPLLLEGLDVLPDRHRGDPQDLGKLGVPRESAFPDQLEDLPGSLLRRPARFAWLHEPLSFDLESGSSD